VDRFGLLGDRSHLGILPPLSIPLNRARLLRSLGYLRVLDRCTGVAVLSRVAIPPTPPAIRFAASVGVDFHLGNPLVGIATASPVALRPCLPWLFSLAPRVRLPSLLGATALLTLSGIARNLPVWAILWSSVISWRRFTGRLQGLSSSTWSPTL